MVSLVTRKRIRPVIDSTFELADGNAAYERMRQGLQFGKIILNINQEK